MINLQNGCRCSNTKIYPSNWKTSKAKLGDTWYADIRFTDPAHLDEYPKGFVIRLKGGINRLKSVSERRQELQSLVSAMGSRLKDGYNPIRDKLAKAQASSGIGIESPKNSVNESTPFIEALKFALEKSIYTKDVKADIRSALSYMETAAQNLQFDGIPISEIQVKHVKLTLDECVRIKFSTNRFNKVRISLMGLFKYLVQIGAAYGNMAAAVDRMKEPATRRIILKDDEIQKVKEYLWRMNRPFYYFMMLFYYSGGRMKELFRLQGKDVDLVEQKYTCLIKKGKNERLVARTIRDIALPLWKEQMKDCKSLDYVFSKNLEPGPVMINSKQVTRRWNTHVKKTLGIRATFYKLKHLSADRTVEALGAKIAAGQAGHTSTRMIEQVYAYNEAKRIHSELKNLDIEL